MLKRAGPDGMSKVVNEFTANHPEISKRQTDLRVYIQQHTDTDTVTFGHLVLVVVQYPSFERTRSNNKLQIVYFYAVHKFERFLFHSSCCFSYVRKRGTVQLLVRDARK